MSEFKYPKLHNATWPGLVGKGEGSEPIIPLDTMLEMTANAEVDGIKFDGIDLGLFDVHFGVESSDDEVKKFVDKVASYGLEIGSLVAPIWPPDGGSAMGSKEERDRFKKQVELSCKMAKKLNDLGIRHGGVIRIDSADSPDNWLKDPERNTKLIAQTFREACDIAADYGESLAAEGEICWAGMHSWRKMIDTLEAVDRPNIGFQADMSHTFLYLLGYNSPEDRILPEDFQWEDRKTLEEGLTKLTHELRPWTIDFHVAQNDGTAHGTGAHDKTGRHCQATDPNGKLDVAKDAGHWLRDDNGKLTKKLRHVCWDGCMFPNDVMMQQKTWNDILAVLIEVRRLHGWND